MHVTINGREVLVTSSNRMIIAKEGGRVRKNEIHLSTLVESDLFQQWLETIDPSFTVKQIEVGAVTMFGPRPGFLTINADVVDADGDSVPGTAHLRGDSVAILVELVAPSGRYAVLTRQARFPAGDYLLEIPAGMMDGSGNFKGKALEELAEEVPALSGKFTPEHVMPLSDEPIWISPGGSNERMGFHHLRIEVCDNTVLDLIGTDGGIDNHEKIKIVAAPWEELYSIPDAKLQIALALKQGECIESLRELMEVLIKQIDEITEAIRSRSNLRWVIKKVDKNLFGGTLRNVIKRILRD
jgi:ADP-sugar diphosphatase